MQRGVVLRHLGLLVLLVVSESKASPAGFGSRSCISERIDCGSEMMDLYGLDFWRADLVVTLDFERLLTAAHSVTNFTELCTKFSTLEECIGQHDCTADSHELLQQVSNRMKQFNMQSSCQQQSLDKLSQLESCWQQNKVSERQTECQTGLLAQSRHAATAFVDQGRSTKIESDFDSQQQLMTDHLCSSLASYVSCMETSTRSVCTRGATDWDTERLHAAVGAIQHYHGCVSDAEGRVITLLVIITLCLSAGLFLAVAGYIATKRYHFSVERRRRMRLKLRPTARRTARSGAAEKSNVKGRLSRRAFTVHGHRPPRSLSF